MRRAKTTAVTILALVGLMAGSGIAVADSHGGDETNESVADTLLNFGYDMINRIFLWNTSDLDDPEGCVLEGEQGVTYGEDAAGNLTAELGGAELASKCELTGGEVTGPQGQVNHGMFLKLFNEMFDGPGRERGCLIRHIARSDLGKGEQQVRVGEDPDFESVEPGDSGAVDFTSVETDCEKGPGAGNGDEEAGPGSGNGKPPWAGNGKPPWAGGPGGDE